MPTISERAASTIPGNSRVTCSTLTRSSVVVSTPQKRKLRSNSNSMEVALASSGDGPITPPASKKLSSPTVRKSPRRCLYGSPNSPTNGLVKEFRDKLNASAESPLKKSSGDLFANSKWNPRDHEQLIAVKKALHFSTTPSSVVCRENEQVKIVEFCKSCVKEEKSGSLYVCGCPGTGKTMVMEKVKQSLVDWSIEADVQPPNVLSINCTSLVTTAEIFIKVLQKMQPRKKVSNSAAALKHIQNIFSQDRQLPGKRMMLLFIDELDYLITKDRAVLHELFMLTTLSFSRVILIGIANAIDLADRFLPKLQSLNCKPKVITFRAYSKDQILKILQNRLKALPFPVFQSQSLELCARKVAAASGDMRKALSVCRSATEMLESEIKESTSEEDLTSMENGSFDQPLALPSLASHIIDMVQVHHMAAALSKTFRSPVVETIQTLPQHQQMILCSAVKLFRGGKKEATVGELNKSYEGLCKSTILRPVGISEMSSMCRVLSDQGLLKIGHSHNTEKLTLKVDASDITFALQGVRFFRNCLQ